MISVREELADCASDPYSTKDDCIDPSRGSVEAVARGNNDGGDESWYVDNKFHNGDAVLWTKPHDEDCCWCR